MISPKRYQKILINCNCDLQMAGAHTRQIWLEIAAAFGAV